MIAAMGCKQNEKEQLLSDEQITLNLANNVEFKPEFLIGEWELIGFAYTENGIIITDVEDLTFYDILLNPHYSVLTMSDLTSESGIPIWLFGCESSFRVEYSILPPNLINLSLFQISYDLTNSPKQEAIVSALNKAYSFVIKDYELIIYFKGDKNKNLLIFKKR